MTHDDHSQTGEEMEKFLIAMHEKLCLSKEPIGMYWSEILPYIRSLQAKKKELNKECAKYQARYETDMHYQKELQTKNDQLQNQITILLQIAEKNRKSDT